MGKNKPQLDEQMQEVIRMIRLHNRNGGTGILREDISNVLDISVWKARKLIIRAETILEGTPKVGIDPNDPLFRSEVVRRIKKATTIKKVAEVMNSTEEEVANVVDDMEECGYIILRRGNTVQLGKSVEQSSDGIVIKNHFHEKPVSFGVIADMHLCSKAERLDVLNAAYDEFARRGINTVLCPGNYIDGECRFNTHELLAHGIADQCQYAIDHWPSRPGIKTYFVDGDDHEGWFQQREGIEFGRYLMLEAQAQGRDDLVYMGYMEADFELKAPNGSAIVKVIHAGGGSSYAYSYASQKLVECVPTDTEILTPNGWKKHDEINIGDIVLGFNKETGRNEWTKIKAINVYKNQLVRTYKNDNFQVTCTPNHKWIMEWDKRGSRYKSKQYTYPRELHLWTIDESKSRSRIVQAALSPNGPGAIFKNHEDIIDRKQAVQIVLQMTSEQRQAFIYGFMVGEGTKVKSKGKPTGTLVASQNPGAVHDAFVLACALEGKAVSVKESGKQCEDGFHQCNRMTVLSKNKRMVSSMEYIDEYQTDVWCPTTELGTWIMKQGNVITITGNSFQGGEKPAVCIIGHYHKMEFCFPRNVYCIQAGCMQDQTRFMRKRKLAAHVGFCVVTLQQDIGGSITRFSPEFFPFWDRGYYLKRDGIGKRLQGE